MKLDDFHPLTDAEQRLVDWLQAGNRGTCEISGGLPPADIPETRLRATLIRHLALGGCDACRPPDTGVRVQGAWIAGDDDRGAETQGLDFEGATLPGDLALVACRIPDLILLRSAKVKNLFLMGAKIDAEIGGDRLQAEGNVVLRGAEVAGTVRLLGARIGRTLDCDGAKLRATGNALHADGLQAEGGVFLNGAEVDGTVRLLGARIGGDLSCAGAKLRAKGDALSCDRLQAEGGVFLRGAEVAGTVRLLGARIGGDLSCEGAKLRAKGNALSCDRLQAEGSVFLRGAEVAGEVRLLGARIGGGLDCDGAKLWAGGDALSAEGARIKGALFLREGAEVAGRLSLTAAEIGAISDDPAGWPPRILLDRCRYGAFLGNNAPTDAKSRLDWLSRIPTKPGEFWPDAYEHCAKVLREMGHPADAREILIAKERLQRKARRVRVEMDLHAARRDRDAAEPMAGVRPHSDRVVGLWWHLLALRIWDGILATFVGYGRKPQNAAVWGLGMLVIGWLVFAHAAGHGAIKPNLPQVQLHPAWVGCADDPRGQLACFMADPQSAAYPRFNALIYSADTLIPVVSLEMQSYWIPDDRTDRGMLVRAYLWFHISMGWALTLLAVAGFSGLIKTDSR